MIDSFFCNGLTPSDCIQVFSAIGTLITALLTLFTLSEMKSQRVNNQKPSLFISCEQNNYVHSIEKRGYNFNNWGGHKISEIENNPSKNRFKFELYNLGNGFAKEVTINYLLLKPKHGLIIIEKDNDITITKGGVQKHSSIEPKTKLSFLQNNNDIKTLTIVPPNWIQFILTNSINNFIENSYNKEKNCKDLSEIIIKTSLTFKDSFDIQYKNEFYIFFEFASYNPKLGWGHTCCYNVTVKKGLDKY